MTFGLFTNIALVGSPEHIYMYVPSIRGEVLTGPATSSSSHFPSGGTCFLTKTWILTPCLTLTRSISMAPTLNHTSMLSYLHGSPSTRRSGSPRSRLPKSRIHTMPRWTGRSLAFSPRPEGVRNVLGCSHPIPRAFSLRSSEERTALVVFYPQPRTTGDICPVHDLVSGSLPPATVT